MNTNKENLNNYVYYVFKLIYGKITKKKEDIYSGP